MRKMLKWTWVIIGLSFIGLQFTGPARTNPSFDESKALEATTAVPPEVAATFIRSCKSIRRITKSWGRGDVVLVHALNEA